MANTGHGERDEFADLATVRAWWRGLGAPARMTRTRHDATDGLAMLRTLRAVIRRLALCNNGIETDLDTSGLDDLTLRADLRANPALCVDGPGGLVRDVCAATVTALIRASARPSWPRLKACRGADCGWVFIDSSRNASRRWCDMAVCGNRAKSTSFRIRRRSAETPT